jgi:hypothetical protein
MPSRTVNLICGSLQRVQVVVCYFVFVEQGEGIAILCTQCDGAEKEPPFNGYLVKDEGRCVC